MCHAYNDKWKTLSGMIFSSGGESIDHVENTKGTTQFTIR